MHFADIGDQINYFKPLRMHQLIPETDVLQGDS